MSRKCKPGIRARIIRGRNNGQIVVVVRRYFGEAVSGGTWPRALFPWVVTSLGSALRSAFIETGAEALPSMTIVVDDCDLEPLDDGGPAIDTETEKERRRGKHREGKSPVAAAGELRMRHPAMPLLEHFSKAEPCPR